MELAPTSSRAEKFSVVQVLSRLFRSSLFVNLFSVTGAQLISTIINLIPLGYAARVVGPERYGCYAFSLSVIAYAGILMSPGLITWGYREVARNRENSGKVLCIVNGTMGILAIVAYGILAAYAIAALSGLKMIMVLLCGTVMLTNIIRVEWVFRGMELMRIPAAFSILSAAVNAIALFSFIRQPDDVIGLPLITAGVALAVNGLQMVILFGYYKVRPRLPSWLDWKACVRLALPLTLLGTLIIIHRNANNLLIDYYGSTQEVGHYYAAFSLILYSMMIPGILMTVFLPRLSRLSVESPDRASREAMLFAQSHMIIAFLLGTVLYVEAPGIVSMIYSDKYSAAAPLLRIMSPAVIFNYAICGYTNCLISFGHDKLMVFVVSISCVIAVGGGWLMVSLFGTTGAAFVVPFVDLGGWLFSLCTYRRVIGSLQFDAWVRPIFAGLITAGALILLAHLGLSLATRLIVCVPLYGIIILGQARKTMSLLYG